MLEKTSMNNDNLKFDNNCIHCYTYFNDRKLLLNKHKYKYDKIEEIFPINFSCPNKDCYTLNYDSDDEEEERFQPGVNYDNWDIEPKIKIFKKKPEKKISELQILFNKINLNKNLKKKRKYKQLKIT